MNQAHDVVVVLTHDRKYSFHSGTLARSSTFFANILTEPHAVKLSNTASRAGIKTRWMVELVELPSDNFPAGQLNLVELTNTGERVDGYTDRVLNENGRIPTKIFDHWERVLYAFYGTEILIADADMGAGLTDCGGLVNVAEYLGCINLIGKPVEVALLKHGQALFRSVQAKPHLWADLSYRIRSENIFREAMIHLAGNWNTWRKDRAVMVALGATPVAKQLAEKYHRKLVEKSKALESRIMAHYPGDLATPISDFPIKREEYAKDILIWMALGWFRHWFGQRIIAGKGYHADDGGYDLYKKIGAAGDAYMDKAILTQFHSMFPMTKKALNVLENHLLEIKECMKDWVDKSNILKSTCQLNVDKYPVDYITCVEFEKADYPWVKDEIAKAKSNKLGRRLGGNEIAQRNLEAAKRHQEERDMGLVSEEDSVLGDEEEEEEDEDETPVRPPKRARNN